MKEDLLQLKEQYLSEITNCSSAEELEKLRVKIFGKKGDLTLLLRGMGKLSKEERPVMGKFANEVREELEALFKEKADIIKKEDLQKRIKAERIDITAKKKSFH